MRILVAGAGAIGQWLGARLAAAGHDVTLLLRPPMRDAVAAGLRVRGDTDFEGPIPCITEAGQAAPASFAAVFLTAKAYATLPVAQAVAPLLADDGVLASLQNGLGNGEKLCAVVDEARAAVCLTSHGVTLEAPGRIHHAGTGVTKAGPVPGSREEAGARVAHRLLAGAGLDPVWCRQTRGHVWQKAIVNAAINPVGALHGVRNGAILEDAGLHTCAQALAREAVAVAGAAGVALPPGDPLATVDTVLRATAANKCSMLQDVQARRRTEVEEITGALVAIGQRYRVAVPASVDVLQRLRALEDSYLEWTGEARSARAANDRSWAGV